MIKKALFGLALLMGKRAIGKMMRKTAGKVKTKVLKRLPGH